ncbi:integrase protein-related [Anaeramoeba ignava]|uniref:Integrase protein-related n=1 Tax=Anaeramoeba ignava TaxID=1746090 RepID=A0A9Q0RHF7_ANAIG|nr:integrase protein-related [Anaeramoeba ignava]
MERLDFANLKLNQNDGFYFQGKKYDILTVIQILVFLADMLLENLLLGSKSLTLKKLASIFQKSTWYISKLLNTLKQTIQQELTEIKDISHEEMIDTLFRSIFISIYKIEKRYQNKFQKKKRRKLKKNHKKYIKKEIEEKPSIFLKEMKLKLKNQFDLDVSVSTLYKTIRYELHFTHKKLMLRSPRRFLPENEELIRVFQQKMENFFKIYGPDKIIFLDETGVNLNSASRNKGWAKIGENSLTEFHNKDKKHRVNSLAAFGTQGFLCVSHYDTTIKAEQFLYFMIKVLLPVAPRECVLILDNCRIHHAVNLEVSRAFIEKKILVDYLPPYCPEFNPIEMAFGNVKQNLKNHLEEFKANPVQVWDQMFQKFNSKQKAKRYYIEDYSFLKNK